MKLLSLSDSHAMFLCQVFMSVFLTISQEGKRRRAVFDKGEIFFQLLSVYDKQ